MNLSLVLFIIGILGFVLNRKNIILMLISIEIMLLAITFLILVSSLQIAVSYLVSSEKALLFKPFIPHKKIEIWNMLKGGIKSSWENKWLLAIFLIIAIFSRVISVIAGSDYLHYFLKLLSGIIIYTYIWIKNNEGAINKGLICRAILNKLMSLIVFTLLFALISTVSSLLFSFLLFYFFEMLGEWIFGYNVTSNPAPPNPTTTSEGSGTSGGGSNGMSDGNSGPNPGGNPGPENNAVFGGATANGSATTNGNTYGDGTYPNNSDYFNNGTASNSPEERWTRENVVDREDLNRLRSDLDTHRREFRELRSQMDFLATEPYGHDESFHMQQINDRLTELANGIVHMNSINLEVSERLEEDPHS